MLMTMMPLEQRGTWIAVFGADIGGQVAVDQRGRASHRAECLGHVVRVGDGGTENDALTAPRLFSPVADHRIGETSKPPSGARAEILPVLPAVRPRSNFD